MSLSLPNRALDPPKQAPLRRRIRLRRSGGRRAGLSAVLVVLAIVLSASAVVAAFVASTSNSGNSISAGSVVLTDEDGGAPFATLNMDPGTIGSACQRVIYNGTLPAHVRLYGTTTGTGLESNLGLTIIRGTRATGGGISCTGFTADAQVYLRGMAPGVVFAGTLADFPDAAAVAIHDKPQGGAWATGEVHTFQFIFTGGSSKAADGKNASQTFTWMADSKGSTYDTEVLSEASLVSYWRLDERTKYLANALTATDSKGTNQLSQQGGVSMGQASALNNSASTSMVFDGINDSLYLASPVGLNTNTFTIEAWFKTSSASAQIIYRSRYAGQVITLNANGTLTGAYNDTVGGAYYVNSTASFADGQWHHVAYTKGATGTTLYVDGAVVATDPATTTMSYPVPQRVAIGKDGDADNSFFNGSIDEVAYYNTALTPARIQAHYGAR